MLYCGHLMCSPPPLSCLYCSHLMCSPPSSWLPDYRYYQTLRLWLDEPRLHDSALYIPGLPQSYDPSRLDTLIQADRVIFFFSVHRDMYFLPVDHAMMSAAALKPRTVFLVIPASKGQSSHTSYYVAYHKLFHTCSENVTTVVHFTPGRVI